FILSRVQHDGHRRAARNEYGLGFAAEIRAEWTRPFFWQYERHVHLLLQCERPGLQWRSRPRACSALPQLADTAELKAHEPRHVEIVAHRCPRVLATTPVYRCIGRKHDRALDASVGIEQ